MVGVVGLSGSLPVAGSAMFAARAEANGPLSAQASGVWREQVLQQYCGSCHNDRTKAGSFSISALRGTDPATGVNTGAWEQVYKRMNTGEMPPRGMPRPNAEEMKGFTGWLEASLDDYAAHHPNPGRGTLRRLNRVEYANAVRDLLAYEVDVSKQLPADDAGYGFDNIADVLTVSPTLMDRYVAVAGRISRTTTGLASRKPFITVYEVPKDASNLDFGIPSHNERASDDLPLDSRGGGAFPYYAPHDGTYELRAYLNPNTNTETDRLPETLLRMKLPLKAGKHTIGMAFAKQLTLDESVQTLRNEGITRFVPTEPPKTFKLNVQVDGVRVNTFDAPSYYLSRRYSQATFLRDVLQMEVEGPFEIAGAGDTPSRRRIFICRPARASAEQACAKRIVTSLARQAYRRPVTAADVAPLMQMYKTARAEGGFEVGIEAVVQSVLVSPKFLFLVEDDPRGSKPGDVHRLSDVELASRLSFFLWSSIPDEELLSLAERGRLKDPKVLEKQVDRMLADPKADALTDNFAAQWLYLRNLDYQRPDVTAFPEFDNRLRMAMRQETEMFFSSIVRDDRSLLELLNADYTFLNQRLAEHYGIPGVYGTAFRRVKLDPASNRGGLLGQGSILTVTSYGNRTSVVRRGKWIMESLMASSPPPPPPDIPALQEVKNGKALTGRAQLELHRSNAACASCHNRIDPLGFALENYDPVGAWRVKDVDGSTVDTSAVLADGTVFSGYRGLKSILLDRKDQFTDAFTDRLLTYALGRGLEAYDMPAVRAISRKAAVNDYRMHSIILGIVTSEPFTLRRTPEA